jgi:hypothetical protein
MENSSDRETADTVEAILHEAKALAARYFALTGKPLGVTGEVAELEAAEKLNLVLTVARNPDYDAFRSEGHVVERFQIKGRAVDPIDRYRGRMPSVKYDGDFEWVLLVLLNRSTFDALEIWQSNRHDVGERLRAPGSKARNERKSMGITQFKSIARKVWPDLIIDENKRSRMREPGGAENNTNMNRANPDIRAARNNMSPAEAIRHVRQRCKLAVLQSSNTRFANINKTVPVWWLEVPFKMVAEPNAEEFVHLLLYDRDSRKLHHLRVPTSYLRENLKKPEPSKLRERSDKESIALWLSSTDDYRLFQDTQSGCRFQHFVCSCSG